MVKTRRPRVSVILHGRDARALSASLDSVREQTRDDWEILIATDALDEATRRTLADDPRYVPVDFPDGTSGPRAKNLCVAAARGLYVAFLEAGDRWHPRKLEVQGDLMRSRPRLALSFTERGDETLGVPTRTDETDAAETDGSTEILDLDAQHLLDALVLRNIVPPSSAMVRASALRVVGRFDEDPGLRGQDEYELWLRLARRGGNAARIERPLTRTRSDGRSPDERRLREQIVRRALLRRIGQRRIGAGPDSRAIRRSLARTLRNIGRTFLEDDRVRRSRIYLQDSIRTRPVQLRSYMLLVRSFLPSPRSRFATRVQKNG